MLAPMVMLGGAAPAEAAPATAFAQYRAWMIQAKATHPYPQSVEKMYSVMMCESSGNPNAVGDRGKARGLFQYHAGTWNGAWNPYRHQGIWNAKSQIYATAKAWS